MVLWDRIQSTRRYEPFGEAGKGRVAASEAAELPLQRQSVTRGTGSGCFGAAEPLETIHRQDVQDVFGPPQSCRSGLRLCGRGVMPPVQRRNKKPVLILSCQSCSSMYVGCKSGKCAVNHMQWRIRDHMLNPSPGPSPTPPYGSAGRGETKFNFYP